MMRILLTGAKGQLGWEILRQAPDHGINCIGIDIAQADITDPDQVARVVADSRPELLINSAAYTRVDAAEAESEAAFTVNRDAAGYLARACREIQVPMIQISTDFVFDGQLSRPYEETDPVAPLSVYGRSKAAGEAAMRKVLDEHLVVRIAWLYGIHGQNFVKSMLKLGREHKQVRVVSDQIGCPTFAGDVAGALLTLCRRVKTSRDIRWGTYHLCGRGAVSWHGFAEKIFEIARPLKLTGRVTVEAITTAQYPTPAPRPAFSVMSCDKIREQFGVALPPWQTSLAEMLKRLAELKIE